MKIYDISQEVFGSAVFPGDPAPEKKTLAAMTDGSPYNLTAFSMCAHNGTHIDAPCHFIKDGMTVDKIPLYRVVGRCAVASFEGRVTADGMAALLSRVRAVSPDAAKRILVKGKAELSLEAAKLLAEAGIYLYGNESQTVGPEDAPMAVHRVLLGEEVILLEGIRLSEVPNGLYTLVAAPLSLAGADGAPCRAILIGD
ncbi:MAG: cyclase family protein [Clostridia bacterium]|nr:cyclase family protein [Clostridia bacterium]